MAKKYSSTIFSPKNPEKYVGNSSIKCRSSWELSCCLCFDNNPAILQWASEPFMVPYRNPFTGKNTIYVPDFLIVYMDKSGKKHAEILEIKPKKETAMENTRSPRDRAAAVLNMAKWQACQAWCAQQGLHFRIVTEDDIFAGTKKSK